MDESCLSPICLCSKDANDIVLSESRDSADVFPAHARLKDTNEDPTRVRKTQIRQLAASGGCIAYPKSHGISGGWAIAGGIIGAA
jgi:hypothetical protein